MNMYLNPLDILESTDVEVTEPALDFSVVCDTLDYNPDEHIAQTHALFMAKIRQAAWLKNFNQYADALACDDKRKIRVLKGRLEYKNNNPKKK